MSKAQNIADTIKWKKRRKNHIGDKCKNAKCIHCARHKTIGNSKKLSNKQQLKNDYIFFEESWNIC